MSTLNIRRAPTDKLAYIRDAKRKAKQQKAPTKLDVKVQEDEKKEDHRQNIRDEIVAMMNQVREFSIEHLTLESILKYLDEHGFITEKQSRILAKLYLDSYDNKLMRKK